MNRILEREALNPTVTRLKVEAPLIARKAEPGQFVILRTDEDGERIPLTVADYDREEGSVTVIFQVVGATTEKLNHLQPGDMLARLRRAAGPRHPHRGPEKSGRGGRRRWLRHRVPRGQKAARAGLRGARHRGLPQSRIWSFWKRNSVRPAAASCP